MAKLRLEIITAERVVLTEDDVDMVVAPGIEGQLGILPRHAPLMTMLQPGELKVKKGSHEMYLAITGGFLEVLQNRVTILADAAESAAEINIQRAEEAKRLAQEALQRRGADIELQQALAAARRAEARLKVARRRRGPPTLGQPQ
jgi:F-type H+-transporting ATPase subunit epsilon